MEARSHIRRSGMAHGSAVHTRPRLAPRNHRRSDGGYAVLAILLGAILLSIFLVRALPRAAMSAQRIREERLINHGEEYARAIKLYFREHQKYPEDLDDLEDTNGVRYLPAVWSRAAILGALADELLG